LVDEAPGEPRPQVLPQRELRRRCITRREHHRRAIASGVDGDEQRLLRGRLERLDVVGNDHAGVGLCRRAKEVGASAPGLAPEVHDRFHEPPGGQRAHALQRLGVRARHVIFQGRLGARRDRKRKLPH
jgi:hypothetical protein